MKQSSEVYILGCEFDKNEGAFVESANGQILDSFLYGTDIGGGAIAILESSDILIADSTFTKNHLYGYNKAVVGGGAVTMQRSSLIKIHNCKFENNIMERNERGGALFIYESEPKINLPSIKNLLPSSEISLKIYLSSLGRKI